MTHPPAATTVWIVDDDLGFVWWLGELFTEAGCRALPALGCDDAVSLMKKLHVGIDLLVVNPQLPEFVELFQALSRANTTLKVITIGNVPKSVSDMIHPHATLERPSGSDPISRSEWLKKVRKLLKEVAAAAAV